LKVTTVGLGKPVDAAMKFEPLIVTVVPVGPLLGLIPLIVGAVAGPGEVTVKLALLTAVPAAVVTLIGLLLAPLGTLAVICVSLTTLKAASSVPSNATAVAPLKPAPVIVTAVPGGPEVGVNPEIVGGGTVKLPLLVPVPWDVVTLIGPVVVPPGTMVVIWVSLSTVKRKATVPLKATAVAPVKLVPVIVTIVPGTPEPGVKPVIPGVTVKLVPLVPVPPEVVTLIGPVDAPAGTVTVIWVSLSTVKEVAAVPLKATAVAPVKPVPLIVTPVPVGPELGVKPVIPGVTVKLVPLVPVPPEVVTLIGPEVAPAGTVAVIWLPLTTVKLVAAVALKSTADALLKYWPLIVTSVPTGPEVGLKPDTSGVWAAGEALGTTVKSLPLVAVPPEVVTPIGPLRAPAGTVAVSCELPLTVNAAEAPPKVTREVSRRRAPLIVTRTPSEPLDGLKPLTVGTWDLPVCALDPFWPGGFVCVAAATGAVQVPPTRAAAAASAASKRDVDPASCTTSLTVGRSRLRVNRPSGQWRRHGGNFRSIDGPRRSWSAGAAPQAGPGDGQPVRVVRPLIVAA
jgi:hypothetical protein